MAVHTFNLTYEFVSMQGVPFNNYTDQVISQVVVNKTGVDQADNSKSLTVTEYFYWSPTDRLATKSDANWTSFRDVTPADMEGWDKNLVDNSAEMQAALNMQFTCKIYGTTEADA